MRSTIRSAAVLAIVSAALTVAASAQQRTPNPDGPTSRPVTAAPRPLAPATQPAADGPVFFAPGDARRVVFVCDATGNEIRRLPIIRAQLKSTLDALPAGVESYKVLFYTNNGRVVTEAGPGKAGLIPNSAANRAATIEWLERVTPDGTTDPIPALKAAFALKPDLVQFVTDGEYGCLFSHKELREAAVNPARVGKVRVDTVLVDSPDVAAVELLREIAQKTGGRYRAVNTDALDAAR